MFTILVRMPMKENFQSRDLELSHGECGGGDIKIDNPDDFNVWHLRCKRCGTRERIEVSTNGSAAVAMTAVDGNDRPIRASGRKYFIRKRPVVAKRID